jgi:hypothetical protein
MGLFRRVANALAPKIELNIDADPGYFYELEGGHALFKDKTTRGPLVKGPQIPLNCMFEAYWLIRKDEKVGYYFVSQFHTANHGGYLVTWMNNGAGKASSVEVMSKTDQLVVFNYPNRGTLVISPKINEEVQTIFSEQ